MTEKSLYWLRNEGSLTEEDVIHLLFQFRDQAHFNHLVTESYGRHKALDEFYKKLGELLDEISEIVLALMAHRRLTRLKTIEVKNISDEDLVKDIAQFAIKLKNEISSLGLLSLEALCDELEGSARKTQYFLTLK